MFINLKAPICISFNKKVGKQIILYTSDYSHQYKLEPNKIIENSGLKGVYDNESLNIPYATSI